MKGKMLIYHPRAALAEAPSVFELARPDDAGALNDILSKLHELVGGYIEAVPHFTTISIDGEIAPCVAFCHEDGKREQLAVNRRATLLWDAAAKRATGCGIRSEAGHWHDVLLGPVVILTGDKDFMASL